MVRRALAEMLLAVAVESGERAGKAIGRRLANMIETRQKPEIAEEMPE